MIPVAILAGGLATRLRPITGPVPKALIEVAGRPFIDHLLARLQSQGYRRVVVCIGYLGEMIEAHVGSGQQYGMDVQYSSDGAALRGTGGALLEALPKLGERFLVLYGDSYLLCDFKAVERAFVSSGQPALMTVFRNENQWDRSNVLFRDAKIVYYDKRRPTTDMLHIDYGLSGVCASALDQYRNQATFDLGDVFSRLALQGQLAGYEVRERFYEIGSVSGLAEARKFFASRSFGAVQ